MSGNRQYPFALGPVGGVLFPKPGCTDEPRRYRVINLLCRFCKAFWTALMDTEGAWGDPSNPHHFAYTRESEVIGGIAETECSALLKDFFRDLRD